MSSASVTDQPALSQELARLVAPGTDIQVAAASGACARVRAKVAAEDVLIGAAVAGRLVPGDAVSSRIWADGQVHALHFVVEEAEATMLERVDLLLRLVRIDVSANARTEERHDCDLDGVVIPALVAEHQPNARGLRVRLVGVSAHGLEFLSDRGYREGEELDVAYDDGTGRRVACRVRVQRVASPLYGRTRHGCRIVAIAQDEGRRHAHLVSRLALAERPPSVPEPAVERPGRMRRLRLRAS